MSRESRPARSEFASELGKARGAAGTFDVADETLQLGCPMLTRVRLQGRQRGALAPARCSLGYALRTHDDASRCLAVEGPNSCWKAAPNWRVASPLEPEAVAVETLTVVEVTVAEVVELEFCDVPPPNGAHDARPADETELGDAPADELVAERCSTK